LLQEPAGDCTKAQISYDEEGLYEDVFRLILALTTSSKPKWQELFVVTALLEGEVMTWCQDFEGSSP
jgi:hypothetical protein